VQGARFHRRLLKADFAARGVERYDTALTAHEEAVRVEYETPGSAKPGRSFPRCLSGLPVETPRGAGSIDGDKNPIVRRDYRGSIEIGCEA
jgi:hypothetical protein